MTSTNNEQHLLDALANNGFGVYNVAGGKLDTEARYAVADPCDNDDGFYLEGANLAEVAREAVAHLEIHA